MSSPLLARSFYSYELKDEASQLLLNVPIWEFKSRGDRTFLVAAPKLWNALPFHIRVAQTPGNFFLRLLFIPAALDVYYVYTLLLLIFILLNVTVVCS